jgi:hypothetical protein
MHTVLNVVLGVVVLIVLAWVAIMGGVGLLLSRARGGSMAAGFAWGTLLGPIGWIVIWFTTRNRAISSAEWIGEPSDLAPDPPELPEPTVEGGSSGQYF